MFKQVLNQRLAGGLRPPLSGITVSVVSHGQGELVAALLIDLQTLCAARVSKIVVTQNLPEDSEYLRPTDDPTTARSIAVQVRRNDQPLGFAANHNRAFADCTTRYFAVLNPDLRLINDPFEALEQASSGQDVGLVCPRLLNEDGSNQDSARDLITPLSLLRRVILKRPESKAEWLSGAFMFFKAEIFLSLDGFDDKFRLYCEDADICLRLRLMGFRFEQISNACVHHQAQRATHRSLRHFLWHVTSFARLWTSKSFWHYLWNRQALLAAPKDGTA